MSTSTTDVTEVTVDLSEAARGTLLDLIEYIHSGVWDVTRAAHSAEELYSAARRATRLAQLWELANEGVLRGNLDAHLCDLTAWVLETDDTAAEHAAAIGEIEDSRELNALEIRKQVSAERKSTVVDYAHAQVCRLILDAIYAAKTTDKAAA